MQCVGGKCGGKGKVDLQHPIDFKDHYPHYHVGPVNVFACNQCGLLHRPNGKAMLLVDDKYRYIFYLRGGKIVEESAPMGGNFC
jgi:hypothetical protein